MILMPVVGKLVNMVQPKYLIMVGAAIVALSMWHLIGLTGDISYGYAAEVRIFQAAELPFLFLPLTTASCDGLPPEKTNQASALINVSRNIGGSMGGRARANDAGAAPAVPSEPTGGACGAFQPRIPADNRRSYALFPGSQIKRVRCCVTSAGLGW